MSVVVKTYFTRPGEPEEIRRFAVDQDVSSNFAYLVGKISEVYPELKRNIFQLFWKDEEGDMIRFSSDDELMLALGSINGGIFRVFIRTTQEKQSQGGKLHPNVICDICDGPVVGFRYKCAVCPDYDLCSTCEGKGLHKEHFMMRISEPCTQGFGFGPGMPGFGCFGPPSSARPTGPSPFWRGPGGRGGSCGPPGGRGGACGPSGGRGGACGRGRGGGRGRFFQHWMKWMHGEHPTQQQAKEGEQEEKPKEQQPEASAGPGPQEYLRNVGEQVAAMLSPLGIDVQVDVRHNEQAKPAEKKPEAPEKEESPETLAKGSKEEPIDVDESETRQERTPSPAECGNGQSWTLVDMLEPVREPTPPTGSLYPSVPTAPAPMEETPVPMEAPPAPVAEPQPAASAPEPSQQPPSFQPPSFQPPSFQPDQELIPHVAQALGQMREMGYTDDGGWLTQLLLTKNGDISKVLDVLSPVRRAQDQGSFMA